MNRSSILAFIGSRTHRALVATLTALAPLAATSLAFAAEAPPERSAGWEFMVSSGGVIPAGSQRQSLGNGNLTAAQLTRVARPNLAFTATLGWARSRDVASAGEPRLDILSGDLGTELRGARVGLGRSVTLRPFAAIGAGARRYDSRHAGSDATTLAAAYGGGGAELGVRRVRVRLEARDYLTVRGALDGGDASAPRHEVALTAGLRWVAR